MIYLLSIYIIVNNNSDVMSTILILSRAYLLHQQCHSGACGISLPVIIAFITFLWIPTQTPRRKMIIPQVMGHTFFFFIDNSPSIPQNNFSALITLHPVSLVLFRFYVNLICTFWHSFQNVIHSDLATHLGFDSNNRSGFLNPPFLFIHQFSY